MLRATTDADRHVNPEILQFIENLAIADAFRDPLIATSQLNPEDEPPEPGSEGN